MIKKQTLLDFLQSTKTKPSAQVQQAIDALPENFTIVRLGEALVAADGAKATEGAMLAFTFAQHLQDAQDAAPPAAPKTTKVAAKPADERPRERAAVSPSASWRNPNERTTSVAAFRF